MTAEPDAARRDLFLVRGENRRIEYAEKIMRPGYTAKGLGRECCETICALHWCRECRNQYAHCHWQDYPDLGLFFVDLEAAAKNPEVMMLFTSVGVDIPLLKQQEAFFRNTQRALQVLANEYREGPKYPFSMPTLQPRPQRYIGETTEAALGRSQCPA